jgi:peptide/nickel transport system substrate-binding protein
MGRDHHSRLPLCLLGALAALAITASAGAATQATLRSGGTFVFGIDSDPIALDAALSPDTSAGRVVNQMLEGLVELAPRRTSVVPKLATSWKTSKDGLTWTFSLRRDVKFHDGTPFNAAAVCFNFERWYGFKGSLQGAAYLWPLVFGAFRKPDRSIPGRPATRLYRGCQRVDDLTVRLRLARRTTSFLAALAYPNFGIASPTALRRYDADAGEADANGLFHPAGTYGTAHPTGTGPFRFKSWRPGREVVLVRNPGYWGPKAKLDRLVFRTIADRTARLHALERGTIHGLDEALVGAAATIRRNPSLKLVDRPSANVGYVGINQTIAPMNKLLVRQAIAYGLDRATVVRSFYEGRGRLADQVLPPAFVGYAKRVKEYRYDPARSRALLRRAGLRLPVKVDFWFPTDVSRPYMPDPKRNFDAYASSIGRAGFEVVPHSAPWAPDYIQTVFSGKAQLYLLGWLPDVPDPDNFFGNPDGPTFRTYQPRFGFRNPKLFALVQRADAEPNLARRAHLYERASRLVMELLPIVPYVHSRFAVALRRNVTGFVPGSTGPVNESFATVGFASR